MYQFFDVRSNLFKKRKKEEREENGWKIRVRVVNNFVVTVQFTNIIIKGIKMRKFNYEVKISVFNELYASIQIICILSMHLSANNV